jgi:hypothetical protein
MKTLKFQRFLGFYFPKTHLQPLLP